MIVHPKLLAYLKAAVQHNASDLHIQPNSKPYARIDEKLTPMGAEVLDNQETDKMIMSTMTDETKASFNINKEADYAFEVEGIGRLRINTYIAQGKIESVIRFVAKKPNTFQNLNLPDVLKKIADNNEGLVLIAGPTGSGKSTTLASLIKHINDNKTYRIITLENPVEIIHENNHSVISQRELGSDINNFSLALRSVLRQDPDVIVIGEIRDEETARLALQASETGHLVISTLHANSSADALFRFINLFKDTERENIYSTLSSTLKAVITQKLIPSSAGGLVPATEVLVNTERLRNIIKDFTRYDEIDSILNDGAFYGMQSMYTSLVSLFKRGLISQEVLDSNIPNQAILKSELNRKSI